MNSFDNFPDWLIKKWQGIANLLAELLCIPAVLVMKTEDEFMEVFISSHSENNPYQVGEKEKWDGLYCETVIKTQNKLLVPNALKDKKWDKNPDLKLGMIAYLGFSINFPDNQPFGTLCVLDNKERKFTLLEEKLLVQFKNVIELDLALIQTFDIQTNELAKTIKEQQSQLIDKDFEFQKAQKNAVIALQESHQLLKSTFESLRDAVFIIDSKTLAITDCNNAAAELFGYSRQEIVGSSTEFLHVNKEALGKFREQLYKAIAEKGFLFLSGFTMKRKDGTVFSTEHTVVQLLDAQGVQYGWVSVVRDITERKQTELLLQEKTEEIEAQNKKYQQINEELNNTNQELTAAKKIVEENESRMKMALEVSKSGSWDWDILKNTFYWSDEFLQLFGLPENTIAGFEAWTKALHPDDIERASTKIQEAIENRTELLNHYRIILPNNEIRWIRATGHTFYENNKPVRMIGLCMDITDQKKAEQELYHSKERAEESEEKYRLAEIDLLEAQKLANIGSWHWDLKTGRVTWSKELYHINGHNPDIPVPAFADMATYYTPESWKVINDAVARTFNTGEPYNLDFEMVKPDGTVIFTNTRGCAYYDETGEMVNLHGTVQDITERKRLEDVHAFLSTSGYPGSNENFFESLAKYLAQILDSEYVCIDKLEGDGLLAQTVAVYNEGKFDPNVSYTLKHTPCGNVVGKTICCFPENVCQLFPHDEALQDLKAHSYIGTTLWSFDGKPIGLIAIIGQKPLKDAAFAENVLKLVSIRAAGELERIQAEEKLRQSEAIKNTMVSNISDVIVIIDKNGINQYKSPNIKTLFGWQPEELVGKSAWDNVHPDDLEAGQKFLDTIATEPNANGTTEVRYKRKDGEYVWIEISVINLLHDKDIQGLLGNYHDISERKQAEIQLRVAKEKAEENEAYLISVLQSNNDIIVSRDLNNNVVFFNKAFDDVTMELFNQHAYAGMNTLNLLPAEGRIFWENILQKVKNGDNHEEEYSYKTLLKTADYITLHVPVYHGSKVVGTLEVTKDITAFKIREDELKQAKEKAEESDRLKSAFLANMSHEIRTPMNGILGFAELLKEPKLSGEQQSKYISIIEKSGARMLNIINDIIDISKVEAGLMKTDIHESNVNEQIEYIYTFFKPEVEAKGIKLSFRNTLPQKEAIIKTDREKLYAILTNLVKNAIKFTNEGFIEFGYTVETRNALSLLQFHVKDTGIGIPKNRHKAIFERFIQADIADKMAYQGAGLGLAITKAFVEMLGGEIWVESEEGNGSTFYFTLPYNTEQLKETIDRQPEPSEKNDHFRKLKILIAEDDEVSEMLIDSFIKIFGKEILKASTGVEAVEACRNNPDIDLILMDIRMPVMGGYEATMHIREFNKEVVIIAQTAYGLSGDKEKAIAAGCNDYISKPINKTELLTMIKTYFGYLKN